MVRSLRDIIWDSLEKTCKDGNIKTIQKMLPQLDQLQLKGCLKDELIEKEEHWPESKRFDAVMLLLTNGTDINMESDYFGLKNTLAKRLHFQIVKHLIDKGANVNAKDKYGKTPFHEASLYGDIRVVKLLVEKGADVNAKNIFHRTPLHGASLKGHFQIVKLLCENGANVKAEDKDGDTPLHWASQWGNIEVVEFLVNNGANVNAKDKNGQTPLHLASKKGRIEVMKLLIQHEADINALDSENQSSLSLALHRNESESVSFLTVSLKSRQLMDEALTVEIGEQRLKVAEHLLFYGAKGDFNDIASTRDNFGASVLYYAIRNKRHESLIQSLGLHVAEALSGQAALAATNNDPDVFYQIIQHIKVEEDHLFILLKSQNSEKEFEKWVPLFEDIFNKLQEQGINLQELCDPSGTKISTLGRACKNGHLWAAKKLINGMENKLVINAGVPSPLWLACNNGHTDVVKLLLIYGDKLKFDEKAPDGTTPLMMAVAKDHNDIVKALSQHLPMSEVLLNCAKFGKHELISVLNYEVFNNFDQKVKIQILDSAAKSCCLVTLQTASELLKLNPKEAKDWEKSIYSLEIRDMMGISAKQLSSPLVYLSRSFPGFNNEIEEKCKKGKFYFDLIGFKYDLRPVILEEFCCIKANKKGKLILPISEMVFGEAVNCRSHSSKRGKQNCQIIKDLLSGCQLLEAQLNQKSTLMQNLMPKFILIGSVAEGTKLHNASEVDITVQFEGLKNSPFTIGNNATDLLAPECLMGFHVSDKSNKFDYPHFLHFFLGEIQKALIAIQSKLSINLNILLPGKNHSWKAGNGVLFCENCDVRKNESIYEPWTHCTDCLPGVTHTKLGPCLIFQWNDGSLKKPLVVTVDLVPVFPIKGKTVMELYNIVIDTLVNKNPPGWLDYFNGILNRDIILPESFNSSNAKQKGLNSEHFVQVGIKLLNYGPDNNYIIRPAQEMEIQDFQDIPKLKDVYLYMKALKDLLGVNAKSYFMKKVILLPDYKAKSAEKTSKVQKLLYEALSQPDLKRIFEKHINFDKWKHHYDNYDSDDDDDYLIPLCTIDSDSELSI